MMQVIALIPARYSSKRLPGKNIRQLAGHPLVAYAIATAIEADIFDAIAVSSDDPNTLEIAERYGATELILRPEEYAQDDSPDIDWVRHAMGLVRPVDAFCILRPTSPFRRGEWVSRAWQVFSRFPEVDSLRAMRPAAEHPGKMWRISTERAHPLFPFALARSPWHSSPTQALPAVCVQTAALEMAWSRVLLNEPPSISGEVVLPWLTARSAPESVDVNDVADWDLAEHYAQLFPDWLPPVRVRVTG